MAVKIAHVDLSFINYDEEGNRNTAYSMAYILYSLRCVNFIKSFNKHNYFSDIIQESTYSR